MNTDVIRPEFPVQIVTPDDVRESIRRAAWSLERAAKEIVWQVEREAWRTLGYSSWNEMREAEYGGAAVMVPREMRPSLVTQLRSAGLTQQETADTLGVTDRTVKRDEQERDKCPPRRRPITDAFRSTTWDLRKRVESLHRLTEDDRFTRNAETLANHRRDLIQQRDLLDQVIDLLPER